MFLGGGCSLATEPLAALAGRFYQISMVRTKFYVVPCFVSYEWCACTRPIELYYTEPLYKGHTFLVLNREVSYSQEVENTPKV